MFEDWNNGTVVNVIFPNSEPNDTSDLMSFMGSEISSSVRRRFYELTNTDEKFHYLTMWQISTALDTKTQEIMIPIGLGYLAKVGTMDEFTKPIKYYYATNDRTDYRDTRKANVLHRIIRDETGAFVQRFDTEKTFYYNGKEYNYSDFEKYIAEDVYDFYSESDNRE